MDKAFRRGRERDITAQPLAREQEEQADAALLAVGMQEGPWDKRRR